MKFKLSTQLFVAIFGTAIVMALALGAAAHFSFTRGFAGYLNEQGIAKVESILPTLEAEYREHGNWDFMRDNPRSWFRVLRPRPLDADGRPRDRDREGPPADPNLQPDLTGIDFRLSLLDENHRVLQGQRAVTADAFMRSINVDGRAVGYVALLPFERATGEANERFQQQQLRSLFLIGLLAAALAAAVAFYLSRRLLEPVKRIAKFTHQLAGGKYDARVEVTGHHEIGQLMQDFNSLALTLERNEASRRQFVADVSHELRTPLAILRGELEALEDGVRKFTPEALKSLQAETALLGKMVNDLYDLSLSDIGALSYRKTELDLNDVLRASVEMFRDRLAQRSLKLTLEIPREAIPVFADEGRLQQLFGNLLENSARYTDPDGVMRVSAKAQGNEVIVHFDDSPPGVPADVLPKLFDRFYRLEASRNRAHGGAGLGLAICRGIVEAHGGTIVAAPSDLGGVRIGVMLPLANTPHP
jgi:two-component system sensor histidine kinase BaeS